MLEDLGRPSVLAWELYQQEDQVEGQQQQDGHHHHLQEAHQEVRHHLQEVHDHLQVLQLVEEEEGGELFPKGREGNSHKH